MALFGRKLRMLLALPLLLTAVAGCEGKHSWHSVLGQTVIDWIDFVKWRDRTYEGMYAAVLADPSGVGEPVGKVKFMLEGHVDNPSYASKNGDAAFLPKGTALYAIKGDAGRSVLAVADETAIHGYRLYVDRDKWGDYPQSFDDLPADKIDRVELYRDTPGEAPALLNTLEGDAARPFVSLLKTSAAGESDEPPAGQDDPSYYWIVLYPGDRFGYRYTLALRDGHYSWSPNGTVRLPETIGDYLNPTKANGSDGAGAAAGSGSDPGSGLGSGSGSGSSSDADSGSVLGAGSDPGSGSGSDSDFGSEAFSAFA